MKDLLITTAKTIMGDRRLSFVVILLLMVSLAAAIHIGFSIHITELQVFNHYSAFGEANFYRSKWYYSISFIIMMASINIIHFYLIAKLFHQKDSVFAAAIGWISISVVILLWFTAISVLDVASLA